MKTQIWLLTILIAVILINCHSSNPNGPENDHVSCDDFPPALGEIWTYRVIGNNYVFSMRTEAVAEKIGTHVVYRERRTDDPLGLGNYIGCDPAHGKVWVATDSWDTLNPRNHSREVFDTPIPIDFCPYGAKVGTVCQNTIGVGYEDRTVMQVIAYEEVTVPFGKFTKVQKIQVTYYDDGQIDTNMTPIFRWRDENIGMVKELEVTPGREKGVELINYQPAH